MRGVRQRRRKWDSLLTKSAFIGGFFAVLLTIPHRANAACAVTPNGSVDCSTDTETTNTTNLNGSIAASSDRQNLFANGAAISGAVPSDVTIGGFGLQLSEGGATPLDVVMRNRGQLNATAAVNALELDGNGGLVRYSGVGSVINTTNSAAALSASNVGGAISIATGAGAISGAVGINASNTETGGIRIRSGSGLVTGAAGPGIMAVTEDGPIDLKVGTGGVTTSSSGHAIIAASTNGNISVTANGTVSGNFLCNVGYCSAGGLLAISDGSANVRIGGSGTYLSSSGGRAIYAEQDANGLGGITITGSGPTFAGTTSFGQASAIRAAITNPADSSNIIINRSGDISSINTIPAGFPFSVSADIHAFTAGAGNITVVGGAGATLSNAAFPDAGTFGIEVSAYGKDSTGNIKVSTGVLSTLTANGTGIFADNSATAIPVSAGSTIEVKANGSINSGAIRNPVGQLPEEGGGVISTPAGILAGYNGGPVFNAGSTGPYTSCGPFGCTTLAPNPNVNGTVNVTNNAAISAKGGNGIFAFNFGNGDVTVKSRAPITVTGSSAKNGIEAFSAGIGNISVIATANVFGGDGNGVQTTSAGTAKTTIHIRGGTTEGATSGITAASNGGAIQIENTATIQNASGLASDLAVAASGSRNVVLANNADAVLTGTISMTGTKTNQFANTGIWNALSASTFVSSSSITNSGAINVFGATTFRGLMTLDNGGTLNLAAGNTAVTLKSSGNLAYQSGALYVVYLTPTTSSLTNVAGTASLAGTVSAVFAPGSYLMKQYDILHASSVTGTFSAVSNINAPANYITSLSYTPTDVLLNVNQSLGAGGSLNVNQQNVATSINNFFNSGRALPSNFQNLFGLAGGNLASALTRSDGEPSVDSEFAAFQMTTEFLNLMLDPFVEGRLGAGVGTVSGQEMAFAPNEVASLPPDVALAYASVFEAPPPSFAPHWTAWGASYGGGNWTGGNTTIGSSNVTVQTYGFAGGMDYHYSPDTILGFALGGGGTNWAIAGGSGRSDAFQSGVYGITRSGPGYLAAALAFTNHWMTTERAAVGDALTANFDAQSYGARVESGYRLAALPMLGVTPYAAVQAQDFYAPSYRESDLNGGGFGLSYSAMNATDIRTELGARLDNPEVVGGMPLLLRAKLAWAHDFVSDPSLSAVFESLPGTNFTVYGAPLPQSSVLTSAGAELYVTARLTLQVKFDGEFAPGSQTYAGSGTFRYSW